ncbi:PREDICTED: F-box protein At1g30200-like [Camelina sativa]|uniref:F-box protein At1g30200-like n=1 Tax=Camelina sativa TaxID=90675 RepID=A0ABM0WZH6_CAMSA|nr:PREDICTED: F-box protein At1g30200-like [Camelina sativa]XP_010478401.1 PREDICTED: F-box protein At1g30200-like [Camelina sativa]
MSYLLRSDPVSRIHPEPQSLTSFDHFDLLPDSLLLLIFDKVADVKDLGRCCIVSRRFHSLVPFVENVLVRVDCVISDDDSSSSDDNNNNRRFSLNAASISDAVAVGGSFSALFRLVFAPIFKPFQALGQFLGPKRSSSFDASFSSIDGEIEQGGVTHHSPTQVLKNFNEIRFLRIELPTGELGIEDGILLKWRADFGSTLDNCMILGASSVIRSKNLENCVVVDEDNGNIPESFYTNGGLKLRVVWTISSLIAASARHYLLQPIITEHKTLDRLVLSDADGQGVLCMDREQLEELRVTPLSASSASKRTLVPALNMRLWYAPQLDLPDGSVLKGATLVAIRPSESKKEVCDASWLSDAFEEPYGTAAKMLIKRRTYCLEMNSF